MTRALPTLANTAARRLFLDRQGLTTTPTGPATGPDLLALIEQLGFVQVDSINTVERAHHMILFARRQSYRPENLRPLLERDRSLFEHWTHDASILPATSFPHWKHRFARDRTRLIARWETWHREGFVEKFDEVLEHVVNNGPVRSSEVGQNEKRGSGGWWDWHPSKTALEYLWRTGQLAVTRRDGFQKVYDLTERVIHPHHLAPEPSENATLDWACRAALNRLGFATPGEIAAFFAAITPAEAKAWCAAALARGEIAEVMVELQNGPPRRSFALPGLLAEQPDALPERVRILSPFDPALRDRARAERLFGFHYRIEVFVPEAQRRYGYYVFPVLQGDRLIGRIDMKCDRAAGLLAVRAFWPEAGALLGKGRLLRLEAELDRMARFADVEGVVFAEGWMRG